MYEIDLIWFSKEVAAYTRLFTDKLYSEPNLHMSVDIWF